MEERKDSGGIKKGADVVGHDEAQFQQKEG